ncbi:MAG: pyridoxal-phosphate dependent enzyme [Ignavibacterium sp.]|nr:pyridoxal-phosphate dependent enzyme [Ignavibacterium sp.]MDW8374182.1 pyridoxal-phosphate dependent enzyme [Ignavibacteriales bacterium]
MEEKSKFSSIQLFFNSFKNTPLQKLEEQFFKEKKIKLYVKRDDLIHSYINGNKWYKLKYNLLEAAKNNINQLLTFGGAYSNHIYSFAFACKFFGFNGIVVVRGEEYPKLNPTLEFVSNCGVKIHYISRKLYRNKYDENLLNHLKNLYGDFLLIPEGGSNFLAVKGSSEIVENIQADFDYIVTACGTAGTLTGIAKSLNKDQKAIGIAALKNADFLYNEVQRLSCNVKINYEIKLEYHFGGYAKFNDDLLIFIKEFYKKHQIILDPIYTGKLFYAVYDLINKNYFPENSKIVVYHSGGLQGYNGLKKYKQILNLLENFNWSEYEKQIVNK